MANGSAALEPFVASSQLRSCMKCSSRDSYANKSSPRTVPAVDRSRRKPQTRICHLRAAVEIIESLAVCNIVEGDAAESETHDMRHVVARTSGAARICDWQQNCSIY